MDLIYLTAQSSNLHLASRGQPVKTYRRRLSTNDIRQTLFFNCLCVQCITLFYCLCMQDHFFHILLGRLVLCFYPSALGRLSHWCSRYCSHTPPICPRFTVSPVRLTHPDFYSVGSCLLDYFRLF
jgi:hypothetical protein